MHTRMDMRTHTHYTHTRSCTHAQTHRPITTQTSSRGESTKMSNVAAKALGCHFFHTPSESHAAKAQSVCSRIQNSALQNLKAINETFITDVRVIKPVRTRTLTVEQVHRQKSYPLCYRGKAMLAFRGRFTAANNG